MAKLRDSYSTQTSATALATAVQRWLEDSDPTVLFQTCATCHHSDDATARCKKFDVVPPVRVITGRLTCKDYQDAEDIPF